MASRALSPLGARLALAFVVVALAAVAVLGGLTLWASRGEVAQLVDRQQDEDATEIVATLSLAYEQAGGWNGADLSGAFALAASARADLVVLDADGQLVATGSSSGMADMMERMHGDTAMVSAELAEPRRSAVEVDGATVGTAGRSAVPGGRPADPRTPGT